MKKFLLGWATRLSLVLVLLTAVTAVYGAAVTVTYRGVKYKSDKKQTYLMVVSAAYTGDVVVADEVYVQSIDKTLPVTQVGSSAFSELEELTSVTLPESITKIGDYAFDSAINLKTVKMGSRITSIGHWAFRNCYALENMELPQALTTIGNFCFDKNLKMTQVTLPAGMTNIGGWAFEGNPQLKTVYSLSTTPPAIKKGEADGEEIYTLFDDNDYGDRVLYVPAGCVDTYKLEFGWNQFNDIREINTDGIHDGQVADNDFHVTACGDQTLVVTAPRAMAVVAYDVNGKLLFTRNVTAGTTAIHGIKPGILIVNGCKVVVK